MRSLSWLLIVAAVVAAIPCGWMLGVLAARLIVGPEFGVFPVLTIPFGMAVSIWFAVSRMATPLIRLAVMVLGALAIGVML